MRSGAAAGQGVGERRVEPLGGDRDVAAQEAQAPGCAAARRARAPPRPGPGSRCRCRAPARPPPANAGDGAHHRAEPGDDARPAGSRRRRSRRAGSTAATPSSEACLVPQLDRLGAGPGERVERVAIAVAAREDDDPDADRHAWRSPAVAGWHRGRRRRARDRFDGVRLDQRVRQQLAGQALDDGARRGLVGRLDGQLDPPADADGADAARCRGGRGCPRPPGPAGRGCRAWA